MFVTEFWNTEMTEKNQEFSASKVVEGQFIEMHSA